MGLSCNLMLSKGGPANPEKHRSPIRATRNHFGTARSAKRVRPSLPLKTSASPRHRKKVSPPRSVGSFLETFSSKEVVEKVLSQPRKALKPKKSHTEPFRDRSVGQDFCQGPLAPTCGRKRLVQKLEPFPCPIKLQYFIPLDFDFPIKAPTFWRILRGKGARQCTRGA